MEAKQKIFADLGAGGCYYLCEVDIWEELLGRWIDAVPVPGRRLARVDRADRGQVKLDGHLEIKP